MLELWGGVILTCPECGFVGSGAAWITPTEAKLAWSEILAMPTAVAPLLPQYLGFFRPGGGTLHPAQARRLVRDLAAAVALGRVAHGAGVFRPCPPALWGQALETLLSQRKTIKTPLVNHNYLKSIAYALADAADADRERAVEAKRASQPRDHTPAPEPIAPASLEDMRRIKEAYCRKHGPDTTCIVCAAKGA